jgi:hypothetical protein
MGVMPSVYRDCCGAALNLWRPSSVGVICLTKILYIHPAFAIMAAIHQFMPTGDP